MSDLIPKGMSGNEFVEHIQDITNQMPDNKRVAPDADVRMKKAKMLSEAVQAFVQRPAKLYKEKVQAYITSSDLPEPVTNTFDTFTNVANYDMGYVEAFKDASSRVVDGKWEVVTNGQGSNWVLVPEGHSVEINTMSSELATVRVSKFGSGIGWTDEMIRFRQVGRMIDIAEDFRKTFWSDKADRHYSILNSASGDLRAATLPTIEGWIADINAAALTLLDRVKDTLNLGVGHQLLIYAHPQARPKINRALGELSQAFNGSSDRVQFNIKPIFSFNGNLPSAASGETDACLMVIPGYKLQMAEAMPPTFYSDNDIRNLSFIQTAFSYYGAAALDGGTQILTFGLA